VRGVVDSVEAGRPKALANFEPRFVSTLGLLRKHIRNTESVWFAMRTPSELKKTVGQLNPGLKQPWAAISERLRRKTLDVYLADREGVIHE
jgi:hypothetical protein